MSTSLDFQALLSSLKVQPRNDSNDSKTSTPIPETSNQKSHEFPSVSSPLNRLATTSSQIPDRTLSSASPETNPNTTTNTTAQGLLSLLNFGQGGASKENMKPAEDGFNQSAAEGAPSRHDTTQAPAMSASDLVARFMSSAPGGDGVNRLPFSSGHDAAASQKIEVPSPNASQDALLRLLNRSSSTSARSATAGSNENRIEAGTAIRPAATPSGSLEGRGSPLRLFGSAQNSGSTPLEALQSADAPADPNNKPLFTYQNPFEALNASRHQTPNPPSPVVPSNASFAKTEPGLAEEIDERKSYDSSHTPTSTRRKLTPKVPGRLSSTAQENLEDNFKNNGEAELLSKLTSTPGASGSTQREGLHSSTAIKAEEVSTSMLSNDFSQFGQFSSQPERASQTELLKTELPESGDVWESADDSPGSKSTPREVPVYNFPIKPFVSITLQLSSSKVKLRDDGIMEISRLKKEFDQIDRSLAAATSKYISYALAKNGGIRIIRQDDGSDRQVFKNSHDRIFNVAFCSTAMSAPPSHDQAALGTGVSGAVYYATVSKEGNDLFEKNLLDTESLIFPPFPVGDENASGAALKTRAKRSSRHPEFFGIGRGKTINIVWPATALSAKFGISTTNRKVDVEKFYKERSLRITTGKAGKDFAFSEDDSLIVSLDKIGRLRFWDIRPLVSEANATAAKVSVANVDTPLLTLSTASPAEKSWPTSVTFVDKVRPYSRGGALRYLLVGMRQNHTLQLWDLALGKAVQELNFSHESESDGICSISYHPNSGIIVVGHPTRNSLYFIHLSAPRYSLAPMSQAAYIAGIAIKDPDIPKPESTACMSGLREISFADKGNLRSVELLPIYKTTDVSKTPAPAQGLFELYVVHSKGVTCLNISKEDLGWSSDSKVLKPIDAAAEGLISLKEFRLGNFADGPIETRSQSEEPSQPVKPSKKKSPGKITRLSEDTQISKEAEAVVSQAQETLALTNGSAPDQSNTREMPLAKESKKRKKKQAALTPGLESSQTHSRGNSPTKQALDETIPPIAISSQLSAMASSADHATASQSTGSPAASRNQAIPNPTGISGDWLDTQMKKIESGVSNEFHKELDKLYHNLHADRNVQDSAAVARQEAVMRIVSTTLSTNVEKSLSRIVSAQMQQVVVPTITGVAVQAVTAQVGEAIARVLHQLVPHEMGTQMPVAINTALQNPQISRTIAEAISQKVTAQIEGQVADSLQKSILPSFKSLAISAAEKATADVEKRMSMQVRQMEADRQGDVAKIDKLSQVLQGMAETMQAMSDSQVAFQGQILRDRRHLTQPSDSTPASTSRQVSTARQSTLLPVHAPQSLADRTKSKQEIEFDDISNLMNEGKYEEGSIKWLQSAQSVELFDNLFVRFTPEYLATDVSPLVAFSIAITVANSLSTNTARRIEWIKTAFAAVDLNDPEIADLSEHAPALLTSLIQKLDAIDQQVVAGTRDNSLKNAVNQLAKKARNMRSELLAQGSARRRISSSGYDYGYDQMNA